MSTTRAPSRLRSAAAIVAGLMAVATALTGCPDPPPYPALSDDIVFDCPIDCEHCVVPAACAPLGLTAPIAVGAIWELDPDVLEVPGEIDPRPSYPAVSKIAITIGDSAVLAQEGIKHERFALRATNPGVSAVVVHDGAGRVLDLVHVRTAAADGLALQLVDAEERAPAPSPLSMQVGEAVSLEAAPTAGGRRLGGATTPSWSVVGEAPEDVDDDGEVIALRVRAAAPTIVEITALQPGDATLSVSLGAVVATLPVVVR